MPQIGAWLMAVPMIRLLVDVVNFMAEFTAGRKSAMPMDFIIAADVLLTRQARLERRLARARSRMAEATA